MHLHRRPILTSLLVASLALSFSACKSSGSGGGDGGSQGSGGTTAAGGSNGSGGSTGQGGSGTGQGGSAAKGGSSGTGGTSSGTGGASAGTANFTINITQSTAVATVEIVTWSVDVSIDSAVINFGRDQTNFEFQAPVDQTQAPNYRTLLLGMKQGTKYYVQIVAQGGGKTYTSAVQPPVMTGYLPNGLPTFTVTDSNASALYAGGGFTVNCFGLAGSPGIPGSPGSTTGFVLDKDGALVWALDLTSTMANNCSRARMSYDGQYLYAGNFANSSTSGVVYRIGMDGTSGPKTWSLPGRSHDFAVLPNGNIVYFAMDNMMANTTKSPEEIMELNVSTGATTKIYDEVTDFGTLINSGQGMAHTNHITYSPDLQAVTVSMLFLNTIAVVSYPAGKLLATFGGTQSDFSAMNWNWQHGHDVHADHIWVFNNNQSGNAHVLGFTYNESGKTATQTLDYNPGISCTTFGDVKELPNGNLYITYSDTGVFHEINPTGTGTLLRKITTTTAVGYSEHRATMYGPPPPFATN